MVRRTSSVYRFIISGFSLVELLIVIGVISFIAAIAFYGTRTYGDEQLLVNTEKEFLAAVRAANNRAQTGADGNNLTRIVINNTGLQYQILGAPDGSVRTVVLRAGLIITTGVNHAICFGHSSRDSHADSQCGNCSAGVFFACNQTLEGTSEQISSPVTVTFRKGTKTRAVIIEGSGVTITRIYEP